MKPVWKALSPWQSSRLVRFPALAQPVISAKSGVVSYVIGKVLVGDQEVQAVGDQD